MRTRVGYTGGTKKNPTYTNIGDHTESIQLDYDPVQTSYAQLLEAFWKNHDPCVPSSSRQYMTAVFYHNEEQKKLALATKDREVARRGRKVATEVLPLGEFYLAEDYHQKYYLRQVPDLCREFQAIYPDLKAFINSTAVMRVNAYLDGMGTAAGLEKEVDRLGLSPQGRQRLTEIVKRKR